MNHQPLLSDTFAPLDGRELSRPVREALTPHRVVNVAEDVWLVRGVFEARCVVNAWGVGRHHVWTVRELESLLGVDVTVGQAALTFCIDDHHHLPPRS